MNSYIYLIQDGIYKDTNVYKIGKTTQKNGDTRFLNRLRQYNKNSIQKNVFEVNNDFVDQIEQEIINEFRINFNLVQGKEWFQGNFVEMIKIIDKIKYKYINDSFNLKNKEDIDIINQQFYQNFFDKIIEKKNIKIKNNKNLNLIRNFECEFCLKKLKSKRNLDYHIENACPYIFTEKVKTVQCEICLKYLSNPSNCKAHLKLCKLKKEEMKEKEKLKEKEEKQEIKEIEEKEKVKKKEETELIKNNDIINPVNFTNELQFILNLPIIEKIKIIKNEDPILKLIEKIHCNSELPQCKNIKITNIKNNAYKIYRSGKWNKEFGQNNMIELLKLHKFYLLELSNELTEIQKKQDENIMENKEINEQDIQEFIKKYEIIEFHINKYNEKKTASKILQHSINEIKKILNY